MTSGSSTTADTSSRSRNRQVGINLTWLVPGVVGGSEEYSVRLLEGLDDRALPDVRIRLYGRRDLFETYPRLVERFDAVTMPKQPKSKAARILMEQTWLVAAAKDDAVVHHMGGTIPLRPARPGQRQIVTIHDLQPLDMPSNFSWLKRHWLGRMIPRALQRADKVVCPSAFTAERIQRRLSIDASKIAVVQHGYEAPRPVHRLDGASTRERQASNPTKIRLEGRRFLLYPAIAYRHKRHRDAVEALALIASSSDGPANGANGLHLVFTGRRGPESDNLDGMISARGLRQRVHILGRVSEDELDWLYRQASALVFPSEYEGFGNPCLEAMSRGCPVVAASAAALPEVVNDAGLLFPVGDHQALAKAIRRILAEPTLVSRMTAAGREQARRFTPSIASDRLWAVYRELLQAAPLSRPRAQGAFQSDTAGDLQPDLHRRQ